MSNSQDVNGSSIMLANTLYTLNEWYNVKPAVIDSTTFGLQANVELGWDAAQKVVHTTPLTITDYLLLDLEAYLGEGMNPFTIKLVKATGNTPAEIAANVVINSSIAAECIDLTSFLPSTYGAPNSGVKFYFDASGFTPGTYYLYYETASNNSAMRRMHISITHG